MRDVAIKVKELDLVSTVLGICPVASAFMQSARPLPCIISPFARLITQNSL